MARVKMMAGIGSISGKVGDMVFKTYRRRDGKSETRIYRYKKPQSRRSISKNEINARYLFSKRQAYVNNLLRSGDKRTKKELWKEAKEQIKE